MNVEIFIMTGPELHYWFGLNPDARGASGHPVFSFHPRFSLIYLVDELFSLLLK